MSNLIKLKQVDGGVALQTRVTTIEENGHLYFKGTAATLAELEAIVNPAPVEGEIYIVQDTGKKYVRHGDEWVLLSDVVSLSGYATESYVDNAVGALETSVETDLADKVDKETGKGLSTNDFTNELKTKLEGLENYDDTTLAGRVTTLEGEYTTVSGDLSTYQTNNDAAVALKANAADVYTKTETYNKTEVNNLISTVFDYKGTKATVAALEDVTSPKTGDVWFVSADSSEYVWNGSAWEKLGPVIDLSGYAESATVATDIATALSTAESYTDTEIGTLSSTLSGQISTVDGKADADAADIAVLEGAVAKLQTEGTTASAVLTLNEGTLTPGSVTGSKIAAGKAVKAGVDSVRVVVNGLTYVEGTGAFTVANDREIKAGVITWSSANAGFALDSMDTVVMIFVAEEAPAAPSPDPGE